MRLRYSLVVVGGLFAFASVALGAVVVRNGRPDGPVGPVGLTAVAPVGGALPVTVLRDSTLWRVDVGGQVTGTTTCTSFGARYVFFNTSTQPEYIEAPNVGNIPQEVAAGSSADLGVISPGAGFEGNPGLLRVTASDGQTTAYLTQLITSAECRATATVAGTSGDSDSIVPATTILPYRATYPAAVLTDPGFWRIDVGSAGPIACDGFGPSSLSFRNLSKKSETIQGGPYTGPQTVPAGATVDLGNAWPTSSDILGVLHITVGHDETDAYLTDSFSNDSECWASATTGLAIH